MISQAKSRIVRSWNLGSEDNSKRLIQQKQVQIDRLTEELRDSKRSCRALRDSLDSLTRRLKVCQSHLRTVKLKAKVIALRSRPKPAKRQNDPDESDQSEFETTDILHQIRDRSLLPKDTSQIRRFKVQIDQFQHRNVWLQDNGLQLRDQNVELQSTVDQLTRANRQLEQAVDDLTRENAKLKTRKQQYEDFIRRVKEHQADSESQIAILKRHFEHPVCAKW